MTGLQASIREWVLSSPTHGFDVLGSDRIVITVAEVCAHIVHDGGDLVVAEHEAKRRHCSLAVDNGMDGIASCRELPVACERWISRRADRSLAVGHVAALTGIGIELLAGLLGE